jgi:hypothetical protein
VKILEIKRKITRHIFTNTDSSLLSIEYLKSIIFIFDPIHHIEWKNFPHRLYHRITLVVFVDKLSLILWANIEFASISHDTIFLIIDIASKDVTN